MTGTRSLLHGKQHGAEQAPRKSRFLARTAKILFGVAALAFLLNDETVDRADAGQQQKKMSEPKAAAQEADEPIVVSYTNIYGPAFRQLYLSELHFLRLVTRPTKSEFNKISKAGEPSIKTATHEFATGLRDLKMRHQATHYSPQNMIVREIAQLANDTLSPEQNRRLQKEIELRKAARKQASLQYLLARLDAVLLFGPDQRSRVDRILHDHWDESMSQSLPEEMMEFPRLPDAEIAALLTNAQKAVWQGLSKGRSYIDAGSLILLRGNLGDEVWNEDLPGEK